jgi:thiosulfate/3-mercaptopyruvate sulfurtransferase
MAPRLSCLALLLLALAANARPAARYARPDLLLEPGELLKPGVAKKFVVLDARAKEKYRAGHVPGAVWVDANAWARAFAAGQDKAAWGERVGALGVDVDTPVVIYDASLSKDAARIWWVLRYWGVRDVRLLNGGWGGWVEAGGKVEKGENKPRPVEPKLVPQASRLATKDQLLAALKGKPGQIVDARSTGEFCGTDETAKRNGAVPGAVHLEWSDTLDKKTGRFKTAEELTKLFKATGIDPSRPATTYCQSGGRAAVMAFVLELAGGTEARNYYRSWSEWGNDPKTPVVKPKAKE